MVTKFDESFESLTPIQREAVQWGAGAALVLAGPGAGKTRVLTTRLAALIRDSPQKRFRVLALTFTTKAASEMRERVETMLPSGMAEERTFLGTFHAFCTDLLRQHGSHIAIQPNFTIYGQRSDQQALLSDALEEAIKRGRRFSQQDIAWLDAIKEMKSRLITPEKVGKRIRDPHMAHVYELYEAKLRADNVMDFEGLILESCRLLHKMPAIAARIRSSYPYWMIDEFQDTSPGQYWLLHYLSGGVFKNVFIVADDDQIIYQWAGASYKQIEKFRNDFNPVLIQLLENHRCPPEIVTLANRLVAHNTQRSPEKKPTIAARANSPHPVTVQAFNTDEEERAAIAEEIFNRGKQEWGKIAILGRTRALLEPMVGCLNARGVSAALLQRRDNFISPQFVWLQACLDQALRPANKRVFETMVNASNRIADLQSDPSVMMAEAEASGHSLLEHWGAVAATAKTPTAQSLSALALDIAESRKDWKKAVQAIIPVLLKGAKTGEGGISDVAEDYSAWTACMKEIRSELGHEPELSEFLQGLALRPKEPVRDPDSVSVLTVHLAKGLEFDSVYVIGLADGEMPSWQSRQKGDTSPEMEEERRNCFVAITRTRETLCLSWASKYRGWKKGPSRFLKEMNLTE